MGNGHLKLSKDEMDNFRKMYNIPPEKSKLIFKSFEKSAHGGKISRENFIKIMDNHGVMETELANQVFDSFDRDGNGDMDMDEYMTLMGVTFGGNIEQKLRASFEIFDKNGDGVLSKEEVKKMLVMVVKQVTRAQLKARQGKKVSGSTQIEIDENGHAKLNTILDDIFNKVDANHDGLIDINEFIHGFADHPEICGFFKQF
jgi:Ca2+-binding EF-hand superfamily protein